MNDYRLISDEIQNLINENVQRQLKLLIKANEEILSILVDHERDMVKMAEEINSLKRKLSELEEG